MISPARSSLGVYNAKNADVFIDTDDFGEKYDAGNPFPGYFATPVSGEVKVWPK